VPISNAPRPVNPVTAVALSIAVAVAVGLLIALGIIWTLIGPRLLASGRLITASWRARRVRRPCSDVPAIRGLVPAPGNIPGYGDLEHPLLAAVSGDEVPALS
jgi:hypothetical protein